MNVLNTNNDLCHPFVCAFATAHVSKVENMLELSANNLKLLHWKNAAGDICNSLLATLIPSYLLVLGFLRNTPPLTHLNSCPWMPMS